MASSAIDQLLQIAAPAHKRAEPSRTAPVVPFDNHLGRATGIVESNDLSRHDTADIRKEDPADGDNHLNSGDQSSSYDNPSIEDRAADGTYPRSEPVHEEDPTDSADVVEISGESEQAKQDETTEDASVAESPLAEAPTTETPVVQTPVVERASEDASSASETIAVSTDDGESDSQPSASNANLEAEAEEAERATTAPLLQPRGETAQELAEGVPIETETNATVSTEPAEGIARAVTGQKEETGTTDVEQPLGQSGQQLEQATPLDGQDLAQVEPSTDLSEAVTEAGEEPNAALEIGGNQSAYRRSRASADPKSSGVAAPIASETQAEANEEKLVAAANIPTTEASVVAVPAAVAGSDSDNLSAVASAGRTLDRLAAARSVQPASTTPENERMPPVDRARFVQRVGGALRLASQREGQVLLRLSPPELGSLRLEISVKQGALTATLEAETAAARNVLLDNLPALRERLAEQEIRIEKFDVDVRRDGQQQSENPATEDQKNQRSRNDSTSRRTVAKENMETVPKSATPLAGLANATDDGLDVVI